MWTMVLTPVAQGFAVVIISGLGIIDKIIMRGGNSGPVSQAFALGATFTAAQEVVQTLFSRILAGQVAPGEFERMIMLGQWAPIVDKTLYNTVYSAVLVNTPVLQMIGDTAQQLKLPFAQQITLGIATSLAEFLRTGVRTMANQYQWPWMYAITDPVTYTQMMMQNWAGAKPGQAKKASGLLN